VQAIDAFQLTNNHAKGLRRQLSPAADMPSYVWVAMSQTRKFRAVLEHVIGERNSEVGYLFELCSSSIARWSALSSFGAGGI
jgi:hypothetical protein